MFDEIASELKTAREKSLMTLAQVANKSKIDLKFLEAMEHGDFSFLPDLYVRAFVKNFARTVGLDEKKIIKKFEAAKQGIPYVEEEPVPKETKHKTQELPHIEKTTEAQIEKHTIKLQRPEILKKDSTFTFDAVGGNNPAKDSAEVAKKRNLLIGASVFGMIFLFVLIYFLFIDKSEQIIVAEKPIGEVIQQSQRYVEDEQTTAGNDVNIVAADSLILTINTSDTSWIKVSIDEQATDEFILLPNSQKQLKAKTDYKITFGNSGAIKLLLNNSPLSYSGKNRTPLSVVIDKEGVKYPDNSSSTR